MSYISVGIFVVFMISIVIGFIILELIKIVYSKKISNFKYNWKEDKSIIIMAFTPLINLALLQVVFKKLRNL